jgi:hypothetical protein
VFSVPETQMGIQFCKINAVNVVVTNTVKEMKNVNILSRLIYPFLIVN